MAVRNVEVRIVYPTDPLGIVPGGTDTCIRDILRFAPQDIQMSVVGVTTDPIARPARQWHRCRVSDREFLFYPVLAVRDLDKQMRIPLTLRFMAALIGSRFDKGCDVLQFNRIEPVLLCRTSRIPKILFIHQNMNVVRNKDSDIRWRYAPGAYFAAEGFLMGRVNDVYIVREDAVAEYRDRFPDKRKNIRFLPTWMNPDLFYSESADSKRAVRAAVFPKLGIPIDAHVAIFVGRLDSQKDPLFLADAFKIVMSRSDCHVLLVGDGVLKGALLDKLDQLGLSEKMHLLGAVGQEQVASYLRMSDFLVLTSAYEGMPRCVVEALGCGLPVVTTDVGEVNRVVHDGQSGYVVRSRSPEAFAAGVIDLLDNIHAVTPDQCVAAVAAYHASGVLAQVYDNYRRLAQGKG